MRIVEDEACRNLFTATWLILREMLGIEEIPVALWCKRVEHGDDGFALLVYTRDGTCYLQEVYVVPQRRGRGIGTRLVKETVKLAKKSGCKKLVAALAPPIPGYTEPEAIRRILVKLGFREEEEGVFELPLS